MGLRPLPLTPPRLLCDKIPHLGRIFKVLLIYSRHSPHGRRLGWLGLITSRHQIPPNMVVVAVFFKGIKAMAMEAVAVVDVGVLGDVPMGVYKSPNIFQEK